MLAKYAVYVEGSGLSGLVDKATNRLPRRCPRIQWLLLSLTEVGLNVSTFEGDKVLLPLK